MGGEKCTVLGLRLMHKLAMFHIAINSINSNNSFVCFRYFLSGGLQSCLWTIQSGSDCDGDNMFLTFICRSKVKYNRLQLATDERSIQMHLIVKLQLLFWELVHNFVDQVFLLKFQNFSNTRQTNYDI